MSSDIVSFLMLIDNNLKASLGILKTKRVVKIR